MRLEHANDLLKGWSVGAWNSSLPIAIGFANQGIDEPHVHLQITEIYLVARGEAEIRIERETLKLRIGDILVVEPGEAHTFISSSPEYFHFVIHAPSLVAEELKRDKMSVTHLQLGL